MTETAGLSPEDAAAARAAEQARIRKERREAKIKAGGSARLNKITGLGGGIQRGMYNPPSRGPSPAPPSASSPAVNPQQPASEQHHADPEEIDISQHYYRPETTNRIPSSSSAPAGGFDPDNLSESQLRQMMLGFDRPTTAGNNNSNGGGRGGNQNPLFDPSSLLAMGGPDSQPSDPEDAIAKMFSQMFGGGGGLGSTPGAGPSPFGAPGGAQDPNDLFAKLAAMNGGGTQQQPSQQGGPAGTTKSDAYTATWRLLHFVLATGLGLYIALASGFTGTKIERERGAFVATTAGYGGDGDAAAAAAADMRRYFFWTFATAEAVLLTSRFFLDRGRPAPGVLNMVMGFLPEGKWKAWLGTGLRYSQIFTTVRSDILVCVFVMGICAWLRS
ncbi:hypothetical protein M406DRAFT_346306 [Cryphonectria parasitica EP155]|uniref:Uncharacterized protein n=1 Tax=Cryphonectria parasitica (strain ATCC 38755 / EP155) TaxID=660469 RepID=A0A9P5CQE3_CRYP1|nr:uncharacterized protein M406DRAFT_346306 [Cryphonectria parasitica EP155]KAF3766352.1 hypothetical protein M406DRAFT_346306 [Cryphonectria parasitica EP155]